MLKRVWFYNPPENTDLATIEAMVADTSTICMTMGVEREKWLREMKAAGYKGDIWLYWLQNSVHMAAQPNRNNVGYVPGTYADLKKRIPDIFLLRPNGEIVLKNERQDYAVCDVAHLEWKKLFKQRTEETVMRSRDLWTGVWDDDLNVVFHVNGVGEVETRKYGKPDSPEYFEVLKGWLQYQRDDIAAPLKLRYGGNLQGGDLKRWEAAAAIMAKDNGYGRGVVMNEHQFLAHDGAWLSLTEWKKDLEKVVIAIRLGAEVWNVCPVNAKAAYENRDGAERKKVDFFVASHLLAADYRARIRIGGEYGRWYPFDFDEIEKKLGIPVGAYAVNGDEYTRQFKGGLVTVRPADRFAKIDYAPYVEPPKPPETVTLNISFQLTVPAAIAPVIQQAVDSMVITVAGAQTTPTTK